RDQVAWIGTAILGVAALLRVTQDLSLPELATAPAAALLLVAGVHRMLTDEQASSVRVLGSGLTLALLPTLLLAVDEPVSVRGAAIGAVAAAVLTVGVARRWAAPFLAGAGALAVLAVRHLGPVAEALPRWISLGALGVALLAVAITWESRRRQVEVAERYLAALR
ncbi:MAG: SCO7613 C-terminal domain-containing membrane protein, partial [Marmoricola sp.]